MFKENKSKYIIIIYIFIAVLLLTTIPELMINKDVDITNIILFIIIKIIEMLGMFFPIFIYFFAKERARKKVIRESLSEVDFNNNRKYYRNILEIYNPFLISYIDDFEIDYKNDITAMLLLLQLKKKIEIKENNIKIIDSNCEKLKKSEEYIINSINDGKLKITNLELLKESIIEDAKESELVLENQVSKNKKGTKKELALVLLIFQIPVILIGISLILFILPIFLNTNQLLNIFNNVFIPNIETIIFIFVVLAIVIRLINLSINYLFINKYYYGVYKNKSYRRTNKAEELNRKIEGLKNYIKDFSNLKEKERKELILWEDYLIYSVIFGLNTKIIDEISSLIEYKY